LLILDLDNFKLFNDTYRHVAGDRVLATAGKILHRSLRKTDSAFRYGGEDFIVLVPETSKGESLRFAERIRRTFEQEKIETDHQRRVAVTVSIGQAEHVSGEGLATYVTRADRHLYAAKNGGKNLLFSGD